MAALGHLSSTAAPAPGPAADDSDGPRRRGLAGYLLMVPGGVWLALFFIVPTVTLVASSLYDPAGSLFDGYRMAWYWQNYTDVLGVYGPTFLRSFLYAFLATVACVLLGFPLAYAIAFKAGRWKYLMLVAVIAPFFIVPTVTLVASSLYDPAGSLFDGYRMAWYWQNYTDVLGVYGPTFLRSFLYALAATVACLVLGFPLAYAIALKAGRWRNLMLVAVIAPFFTSFLLRTLSWKLLLGDNSWAVTTLQALPLVPDDLRLLATPFAVVTGLTYNFLPFMVLPLYASLEKVDPRLLEAGNDLYASPFTTFRLVTLPLAMPGLVAGTLLTFIPASGDYINSQLLGNPRTRMIGNDIQDLFQATDIPRAAALSVTLMVLIVVMVLVYVRRSGTEDLV